MTVHELLEELSRYEGLQERLRAECAKVSFRELRGDTKQATMSYRTEIPQSVLSRIEKGNTRGMSIEVLARALRAYVAVLEEAAA